MSIWEENNTDGDYVFLGAKISDHLLNLPCVTLGFEEFQCTFLSGRILKCIHKVRTDEE